MQESELVSISVHLYMTFTSVDIVVIAAWNCMVLVSLRAVVGCVGRIAANIALLSAISAHVSDVVGIETLYLI